MDTRSDRGEFYPGGERGGVPPGTQLSEKVDRVNVGEIGESYTLKTVKEKVNQLVRVVAPAATCIAILAVVRLLSPSTHAATAPLEDIPNTAPVVTNEEDSVALSTLATATNALQSSTSAAMSELRSDIETATNNLKTAFNGALAAESNRVESTYAKRSEIPTAPDLAPYALKSELPTDYLKEGDITNFATRAWINSQNYAREGTVYTRLDAQDLAIDAATNAQNAAIAATSNRVTAATNSVWQGVRAASNELARADARLDAKIDALELTGGMTRLWSSDATTYQDATGVVWQVQVVTGLWTVVHSWTTTGLNWEGPWWWGAEGAGEDYYEGPGWYISSNMLTPMRMSEDPYEKEIVWQWGYWDEQDEQEHSITTTCSRTVQWLTNAVNRVAYTNDLATATKGVMGEVDERFNRWGEMGTVFAATRLVDQTGGGHGDVTASDVWQIARSATNYTDRALGAFATTGTVNRANTADSASTAESAMDADNAANASFADEAETAQYLLGGFDKTVRWEVEGLLLASTNAALAVVGSATNGLPEAIGRKQDALPYPTNAIPYAAISGAPSGGGQEWPAELVYTNTPLIFADGEDTNVTSLALHAQPTNYTSLSFLSPVSYYLPNRFSLLELGHDYQIAAAQWFQVGRYLFAQNPENIMFVGGGQHRSLQDYLDACSPQTMADLLSCYIPTNGGGRIHGDLTIDGRLTAGELITITNSDIHAKGFKVENKVLTADGLMASNGMVRINCARFVIGFGTPRIHLETNDLSAITYGGTWEQPAGSVFSWQDSHIQAYLAGESGQQDIELRNPYVRYMDVKNGFAGWKIKGHNVNNGPLKHFTLDNYRTHHFTDADVGNYGIEFTIASNAHVRIVYDFASAPPSAVYFFCGRDGNDLSATMLSNGTELLAPTAGAKTLLEIEHLSGWTFIVKETPLTYENTVMPWIQAQEEP